MGTTNRYFGWASILSAHLLILLIYLPFLNVFHNIFALLWALVGIHFLLMLGGISLTREYLARSVPSQSKRWLYSILGPVLPMIPQYLLHRFVGGGSPLLLLGLFGFLGAGVAVTIEWAMPQ